VKGSKTKRLTLVSKKQRQLHLTSSVICWRRKALKHCKGLRSVKTGFANITSWILSIDQKGASHVHVAEVGFPRWVHDAALSDKVRCCKTSKTLNVEPFFEAGWFSAVRGRFLSFWLLLIKTISRKELDVQHDMQVAFSNRPVTKAEYSGALPPSCLCLPNFVVPSNNNLFWWWPSSAALSGH